MFGAMLGQPFEVDWRAPPSCPAVSVVRQSIDDLLGPEVPSDRTLVNVRMEVRHEDTQWILDMELRTDTGLAHRTIVGERCEDVLAAGALVVAIAVDPSVAERNAERTADLERADMGVGESRASVPEPIASAETRTTAPANQASLRRSRPVAATPPNETASSSKKRQFLGWAARAAGGVGFGVLPEIGGNLQVAVTARFRWFRAELGATYWFVREASVAGPSVTSDLGGAFRLWTVDARGCGVPAVSRVEFPLCAALLVGAMHARGQGELAVTRTPMSSWVGLSAGPGVMVELHPRVSLGMHVDGIVVLAKPSFSIDGVGRVCCTQSGGGQALASFELRL